MSIPLPIRLPGYWTFQGDNTRERKSFAMTRADGVSMIVGFLVPAGNQTTGSWPDATPGAPLGFYLVVPTKDRAAKIASTYVFAKDPPPVCICPADLSGSDPRCPRHGEEAVEAVAAEYDAHAPAAEAMAVAGAQGVRIAWVNDETRVHIVAADAIEAARKADAICPPPDWIRMPEGWAWPVEDAPSSAPRRR